MAPGATATVMIPVQTLTRGSIPDTAMVGATEVDPNPANNTGGVRYQPRFMYHRVQPFGQALVGVARAGGKLVAAPNPASSNAGAAFASDPGGGFDLPIGRQLSLRIVEADYLVTTFDNGANDHQNNLRLSAGVVLHFW